jgi:hypothetical protein
VRERKGAHSERGIGEAKPRVVELLTYRMVIVSVPRFGNPAQILHVGALLGWAPALSAENVGSRNPAVSGRVNNPPFAHKYLSSRHLPRLVRVQEAV